MWTTALLLLCAVSLSVVDGKASRVLAQNGEAPAQVQVGSLDTCWYECVEYSDVQCGEVPAAPANPWRNRRLSQFNFNSAFKNPLPAQAAGGETMVGSQSGGDFTTRAGGSSSFLPKPIDQYTFEEKCEAVTQCRQIEGSGVPCGWCKTGTGFQEGYSSTCRKDGVGNCYPREPCDGIWTWQYFRCPADNEFGCSQECKYFIKKCVSSDFDQRPEDPLEIVNEDFQYFPQWVNGP
mmetsp:Transcript_18912/g.52750  ORF Transcript_18912/g.52750 Transcript_18912/m.52750 type:complete len:235 (+) Transcript_18912:112-816(+)|eukprot:CAMPEP_0117648960 /NCGR_PEP_ID=MMETSP0804-20121206/704_1 /TAXON_ID=1074897 /ORGANISM="Tetraselmis astigmatica, Strain CCMP880" /LENGTH=234 /DNA_ID=CAMNT_0005454639 /DNA_START=31 /DNA_END=735 /DNA_ORIENTATION=-